MARIQIAYRILRAFVQRPASLATLCELEVCHTWALRLLISDSNHFASVVVHSDFDPEFAVFLDRTVSLQPRHSYLTARGAVGSIGHLVWVFVSCDSELQRSLVVRRECMIPALPDSLGSAQMVSVDTVWTTIAVSDTKVRPALDERTTMVAHTACLQLGKVTASWSPLG